MTKIFSKMLVTVAALVCSLCFVCAAKADVGQKIGSIVSKQTKKKVVMGVEILRADTGAVIFSHNAHAPLTPASNMKLIASSAALKMLGPDFKFTTQIGISGDSLVLIGGGDPLLGDSQTDQKYGRKPGWLIDDIAAALKRNNITIIENIIIDTSVFEPNSIHPNWPADQLTRWYASEITGLNYNDNCINVIAKPVRGGIDISTEPPTSYMTIINKTVPANKQAVWCARQAGTNNITVWGGVPKVPVSMELTINKPGGLLAFLIAQKLPAEGIAVSGQLYEACAPENTKILARYETPISDVLARCNKNSLQLAAECLLKTISAQSQADKKNGNWAHARELVANYLIKLGIPQSEFVIDDGCGLSPKDKLSASAITKVLLGMYRSPQGQMFFDSLAVGGEDGTAEKYFKEKKYKGKVLGKTGYIDGVKSFSGLIVTDKAEYIFSILTNRAAGDTRDAINDIVKAVIDSN